MKIYCILFLLMAVASYGQTNVYPANGSVGIGTNDPKAKLHVQGSVSGGVPHSFSNLLVEANDRGMIQVLTGSSGVGYFGFADSDDDYVAGIQYEHAGDNMVFRVNSHTADVVINNSGFVGIGTSPSQKLEVSNGRFKINDFAPVIELFENDNDKTWFLVADSKNFAIRNNATASSYEVFSVHDNGNVGIGITNPSMRLDVNGDMRLRGDLSTINFRRNTNSTDIAKLQYDESGSNFIMAANNKDIVFQSKFNFKESVRITSVGNVGIGTATPDYKLTVDGNVKCEEVKVEIIPGSTPDYVFEKGYDLLSLPEIETYINRYKHLPEVPSAKEMEENGLNLKEMNLLLLRKVEELTLYMIQQQKEIQQLKNIINERN